MRWRMKKTLFSDVGLELRRVETGLFEEVLREDM